MPLDQTFAFAVLAGMMLLFIEGRLRYDLVAILALLAAVFAGIVPCNRAFSGFSQDIVIIVSALIVSAATARPPFDPLSSTLPCLLPCCSSEPVCVEERPFLGRFASRRKLVISRRPHEQLLSVLIQDPQRIGMLRQVQGVEQ